MREKSYIMGGRYKQNQELEELRTLYEKFTREKRAFQMEKESVNQDIEAQKKDLAKTQVSLLMLGEIF